MGTEIKVWQLADGQLHEIQNDDLAATHREKDLEEWIAKDPSLLGSRLLVIGRQYEIPAVGRLDLLCIDETGTLVIVEFKRDLTNREAVAQILDYASWLDGTNEEEINSCARAYLNKPLKDAFDEHFEKQLQSLVPQNHRMLLVAPKLDSSAERIINYLAERHEININAVFFRYAKTAASDEILIRTVLVPDTVRGVSSGRNSVTEADLLKLANERGIIKLVEICRKLSSVAGEEAALTYRGSFRYWFGDRMILGLNVSGARKKPPLGELDVWIPVRRLSEVVGVPEEKVRDTLQETFNVIEAGNWDFVLRLHSSEQAEALYTILRGWIDSAPSSSETPSSPDVFVPAASGG